MHFLSELGIDFVYLLLHLLLSDTAQVVGQLLRKFDWGSRGHARSLATLGNSSVLRVVVVRLRGHRDFDEALAL